MRAAAAGAGAEQGSTLSSASPAPAPRPAGAPLTPAAPADFKETVFLAESQQVNPVPPEQTDNADQPVTCETICRPMNETEQALAGAAAAYAKEAGNPEGKDAEAKAKKQKVESEEPASSMLVELDRKICKAQGGAFSEESSSCEPFMRSTERSVKYDGEAIFSACGQEFGSSYTPCSPYQALALSHMFDIPDHAYYWLWPGGRADQVSNAVFKQQVGHNPTAGMDKCKDGHHVGFFHNWDQAHVDSWGCLHDDSDLRVLCCRRG